MASTSAMPSSGSYPITLSPDLFGGKKRKSDDGELIALKYTFKPASMASFSEASISNYDGLGTKALKASTSSHGEQVFDVREEQSKARECVLVYDDVKHTFTLHPLGSTVHLTLNRTPQSHFARPNTAHSESSGSSNSVPLASLKREGEDDHASHSSGEMRHEVSSMLGEGGDTPRIKRSRPVETRPTKAGKGLPRKGLPAHAPIPTLQKGKGQGRGKANPKKPTKVPKTPKAKVRAPPTPTGKFKSAEIIEDSEEEYDLDNNTNTGAGGDEEDEFAKMVGESLAEGVDEDDNDDDDDDDDEDDDDDDEDEDEELGGARLVVRHQGTGQSMADGESEWL